MYAPISKNPEYALKDSDRYKYQLIDYKYDSCKDVLFTDVRTLTGNRVNIYPVNSAGTKFPNAYCGYRRVPFGTVARIECVGIYLEDQATGQAKFIFNVWDNYITPRNYTFRIMNTGSAVGKKVMTNKAFVDSEKYNGNNCTLMVDTLYDSINQGKNLAGLHIRSTNFTEPNHEFMYINLESTVPEICYNWSMSVKSCIESGKYCVICENLDDKDKCKYEDAYTKDLYNLIMSEIVNCESGIVGYDKPTVYMLIRDGIGNSSRNCCLVLLQDNFLKVVPGYKVMKDTTFNKAFAARRMHAHYYGLTCTAYVNGDCRRFRIPMLHRKTGELVHVEVSTHHIFSSSAQVTYQPLWFGKDFMLICAELNDGFAVRHYETDENSDFSKSHFPKNLRNTHRAFMIVDYEGNVRGIWYNIDWYVTSAHSSIYHVFKMADGSYLVIYRRSSLEHDYVEYVLLHKNGGWYHFYSLSEKDSC
jgi:hypothetical protein